MNNRWDLIVQHMTAAYELLPSWARLYFWFMTILFCINGLLRLIADIMKVTLWFIKRY